MALLTQSLAQQNTSVATASPLSAPTQPTPVFFTQSQASTSAPLEPSPSVAGAIDQLFGEDPMDNFLTLGASLDIRVVSKIHVGEYVDLTLLYSEGDSAQQLDFDPITKVLTMAKKSGKKFVSVTEWQKLFGTYAAVYLTAHPSEGPGVTTYMIRVLELSRQYQDGVYLRYDTLFYLSPDGLSAGSGTIGFEQYIRVSQLTL